MLISFFLVGYILGLVLRLGAGEPSLLLPAAIKFPYYSAEMDLQLFPFRTLSMVVSLLVTVAVSSLFKFVLTRARPEMDVLRCIHSQWSEGNSAREHYSDADCLPGEDLREINDDKYTHRFS